MHGGKSPGAPTGKANSNYRHGRRTQRHIEKWRCFKSLGRAIRESNSLASLHIRFLKKTARSLGLTFGELWEMLACDDKRLALLIVKNGAVASLDATQDGESLRQIGETITVLTEKLLNHFEGGDEHCRDR